ncbi:MAG: hypothetical protein GY877_04770, partial [Hyphomicrobium sp.]|nr:hypothetical protein [Hyphomicrobium sp.]
ITFLRQKLKPPVGIEKPNLRHRAPPESICQASDSHKSEYGLFFEVPTIVPRHVKEARLFRSAARGGLHVDVRFAPESRHSRMYRSFV